MQVALRSFSFLFAILLMVSCGGNDDPNEGITAAEIQAKNNLEIESWKATNPTITTTTTTSGLVYSILEEGNGVFPALSDTVTVDFDLFLGDGTPYTSTGNAGVPIDIIVSDFVPGLQEGIQLLSVGGSGVFLIPGPLGFTNFPQGIESDDLLIYYVFLRDINYEFAGAAEREAIQMYLDDNSIVPDTITGSGLHVITLEEGNGEFPTINNIVTVRYHGTLLDGTIFDSSRDRGLDATFALGDVIQGWQEGIPYISKGGKAMLIIPSAIAYGNSSPSAAIPPNSVLVFEVELKDFQ